MQVLESALERVLYSRVGEAYTAQLRDDHGARVSSWDHHFLKVTSTFLNHSFQKDPHIFQM